MSMAEISLPASANAFCDLIQHSWDDFSLHLLQWAANHSSHSGPNSGSLTSTITHNPRAGSS